MGSLSVQNMGKMLVGRNAETNFTGPFWEIQIVGVPVHKAGLETPEIELLPVNSKIRETFATY